MNYTKYYLQAKDAAEQIRSGTWSIRPASGEELKAKSRREGGESSSKGLMSRKQVAAEQPESNYEEMILEYMSALRSNVSEAGNVSGNGLEASASAIGLLESSNNYDSIGPVMKKGWAKGYSAHGKYGVMEPNIGPWTEAATGRSLTPKEFIADHAAQEAVLRWKLSKDYKTHGSWDEAASIWFSGKTIAKAGNVSDGNLTVPEYLEKFRGYYSDYLAKPTSFMTKGRPR